VKRALPTARKKGNLNAVTAVAPEPVFSFSRSPEPLKESAVPILLPPVILDVYEVTGKVRTGLFVGNNPVNRVDPHGLVGEVVVDESLQWLWDEGEVLAPQVEADAEAAAQATEAEMSSLMQKISNFFKGSNPCPVSRWGRPGLQPGDWVMKGNANPMNYLLSGKYQPSWFPTFGQAPNIPAPYSSGVTFNVPPSSVSWPSGIDAWKGIIGQRIYKP
jgi:hypothetical protein